MRYIKVINNNLWTINEYLKSIQWYLFVTTQRDVKNLISKLWNDIVNLLRIQLILMIFLLPILNTNQIIDEKLLTIIDDMNVQFWKKKGNIKK